MSQTKTLCLCFLESEMSQVRCSMMMNKCSNEMDGFFKYFPSEPGQSFSALQADLSFAMLQHAGAFWPWAVIPITSNETLEYFDRRRKVTLGREARCWYCYMENRDSNFSRWWCPIPQQLPSCAPSLPFRFWPQQWQPKNTSGKKRPWIFIKSG